VDFLLLPGGLLIGVIGLVGGTIAILHVNQKRASLKRGRPWALHVAGMIALGVLAAIPATSYGIRHFCDAAGASAQCGFGGVLGTGPMAFGIAALLYAAAYAIWDVE
jgi:hypothetical protein